MCQNCGKRPGTEPWVGEGGVMDYIHGAYSMWCKPCVLRASLAYAEKQAERIPGLRAEVDALESES